MDGDVLIYERQSTTPEHYRNHDFISGALVYAISQIREIVWCGKSIKYGDVLFYEHQSTTYEACQKILVS